MHVFTTRRRWVALGTAVVALGAAGVAFAYWTGGGSGSGTVKVGESNAVTLTATVPDGIAPGTSMPVSFTAANPGDSPILVTSVHLVSVDVDSFHSGCDTADFSMGDTTQGHQVPAGATAEPLPQDGTLAFANQSVNQDACKGATLTLTLSSL